MTMSFFLQESIEPNGAFDLIDQMAFHAHATGEPNREEFYIVGEKLRLPDTKKLIERPRINALLNKSVAQFPATLVSGRAGTGKTALAASFAAGKQNVAWYTVESTDIGWGAFSRYFSASLPGIESEGTSDTREKYVSQTQIARFLIKHFTRIYAAPAVGPSLIVLDDIHHIFDAPWFGDFFNLLLFSLPPETHLLLLCRSKPPSPLWRLRSKQMLNVIDEKVIAFSLAETEIMFNSLGLSSLKAKEAHRECFGRISKLLQFAA